MSTDHDRIQELLAGYALRALSGEDAAEADHVLDEHVPACEDCRATLAAFDGVTADLALATDPVSPPELLLARLHRDMEPRRSPRAWQAGRIVAVAASVVLIVGVTGLALTRGAAPSRSPTRSTTGASAGARSRPPGWTGWRSRGPMCR